MATLLTSVLACQPGLAPPGSEAEISQVRVWPRDVMLGPGESTLFTAYGLMSAQDSAPTNVRWTAQGGTITPIGEFTAGADTGRFRVTATHAQEPTLSDSTGVTIADLADPVVQIVLEPRNPTIQMGDSVAFSAYGITAGGDSADVEITWITDDGSVREEGRGRGRYKPDRPGQHKVRAAADSVADSTTVTVTPVPVGSVAVSPATSTIAIGSTLQLSATPLDAAGNPLSGRTVTWMTAAPAVVTVDASGLVTALTTGSAAVRATSEDQSGSATVTVTPVSVASVSVSPSSLTLNVGQTGQLTATPRDAAGNPLTGRAITWTSTAPGVATVNASGVVTGQGAGSATIRPTSEGQTGSATVTVSQTPVASVSVNPSSLSLNVGQTGQLTATPRDAAGNPLTGRAITWTSTTPVVASVNASGVVTALAPGTATIRVTSEGQPGSATVTVTLAPVASVTLSPTSASLSPGQTRPFTATLRDAAGNLLTGRTVTWTTTLAAVATVNASGLVTAQGQGSAAVRATSEGVVGSAGITVGGGGGTGGPHEPAGMTQVFYMDGTTKNWGPRVANYGNAWGDHTEGSTGPFTGNVHVVNDAAAPSGKAVQVDYPAGSNAGFSGAAFINNLGGSYRELYIRTVFMYNAGWQQHSSGTTKLFYYGVTGRTNAFYPQGNGGGWRMRWRDQTGVDDDGVFQHTTTFPAGSYYELEIHHVMESSAGADDGYMRMWLNGVELTNTWNNLTQGQRQGQPHTPQWSWHRGERFGGVQLGSYWGGSGDTKTQNDYMRWGEVYISGR